MEKEIMKYRIAILFMIVEFVAGIFFSIGLMCSHLSLAGPKQPKVLYPGKTKLDFEGAQIEGEMKNPGDFYFQHKPEEKMDSLVKRRKNFHREMLRDVVFSK